jgi:hypothetical protein
MGGRDGVDGLRGLDRARREPPAAGGGRPHGDPRTAEQGRDHDQERPGRGRRGRGAVGVGCEQGESRQRGVGRGDRRTDEHPQRVRAQRVVGIAHVGVDEAARTPHHGPRGECTDDDQGSRVGHPPPPGAAGPGASAGGEQQGHQRGRGDARQGEGLDGEVAGHGAPLQGCGPPCSRCVQSPDAPLGDHRTGEPAEQSGDEVQGQGGRSQGPQHPHRQPPHEPGSPPAVGHQQGGDHVGRVGLGDRQPLPAREPVDRAGLQRAPRHVRCHHDGDDADQHDEGGEDEGSRSEHGDSMAGSNPLCQCVEVLIY